MKEIKKIWMTEILTELIKKHQYKMKIKTKDLIRNKDKKPPELMLKIQII